MTTFTRRDALKRSLAAAGLFALDRDATRTALPHRGRAGRVLFLGGTGFLGPHMVQRALDEGYTVTLLTRGRSGRDLFPGVERLVGDRGGDMSALQGRRWDVVIDNSGYVPGHVRNSATLLRGNVAHYIYTSTIDAYRDFHTVGITEDYPLARLPEGAPHNPGRYYGPLKALCEQEVRAAFPTAHTIIRPGWVVGPGDTNHLFTYWVMRVRRGGELLAPGAPSDPTQMVDVRDLAAFVIAQATQRTVGAYNAVAPSMTFGAVLADVAASLKARIEPVWVSADFLRARGVRPYFDLPLWWPPRNDYDVAGMPSGLGGGIGAFRISGERARAAGLTQRSLADTSRDLLAWYEEAHGTWPEAGRPGLTTARERTLLTEWREQRGG